MTVRDPESAELLREIGVSRAVEVTADPVWALASGEARIQRPEAGVEKAETKEWIAALRSWPGADDGALPRLVAALRAEALAAGATLRFLAMQTGVDDVLLRSLVSEAEIIDTRGWHPRQIVERMAKAERMLAMRLHALIFAASVGVPVVAFDYDPKVRALAAIIGAPIVAAPSAEELADLGALIDAAKAPDAATLEALKTKARRNAELAAKLF